MSDNICANCQQSFATNEQIVNAAGQIWHTQCFVYVSIVCVEGLKVLFLFNSSCAQCFQQFEKGIYFEVNLRLFDM